MSSRKSNKEDLINRYNLIDNEIKEIRRSMKETCGIFEKKVSDLEAKLTELGHEL